ncbi:anti-repressor SinI family protein [Paenibacillus sp. NPDC056579]|uniref:anti-repressor SinI family protein n=1 Tax=Paenibacillus sp. NPDC056579 TaxID=3345871 RepID=UPI0036C097F0
MSTTNQMMTEELDWEWANLILTARKLGLSTEDIRSFLRNPDRDVQTLSASVSFEPMRISASKVAHG